MLRSPARPTSSTSARALLAAACGALVLAASATSARAQTWSFKGVVADVEQLDAVAAGGRIHLVGSKYFQFDKDEKVLLKELVGESSQTLHWAFVYAPSIAVAPDGTVSIVVREPSAAGSWDDGWFNARIRRRSPAGVWDSGYVFNTPSKWNWKVGVADDGAGHVHLLASHNSGGNVWSELRLYSAGASSASSVGSVNDVYRVDHDARLRARGGRVYLASSNAFTSSKVYFAHATGGAPDLGSQLKANMQTFTAGAGSNKGFPDLALDGGGAVHLSYGSGYTNHSAFPGSVAGSVQGEVHYNKLSAAGAKLFSADRTLFKDLGVWHLSIGLSAVGASDDGKTVVAVALRSPNHKEASNSELLYSFSRDGGATWSLPANVGAKSFGGEGRQRPRLVALGNKFFLFYKAQSTFGTSLATLTFPESAPSAPTALTAASVATGGPIAVCWKDNADNEDGFAIERKSTGDYAPLAKVGPNVNCHHDHAVEAGVTYTYRARSYVGAAHSEYSNAASATPGDAVTDGGSLPEDAGEEPADEPIDSGRRADAGSKSGRLPLEDDEGQMIEGSCGCRAVRARAAPGMWATAGLLFVASVRRRRVRREDAGRRSVTPV